MGVKEKLERVEKELKKEEEEDNRKREEGTLGGRVSGEKLEGVEIMEKKEVKYPENVNFSNFFYFLCAPTLVYEVEYPRTTHIRWGYFMEKLFSFVGFFFMLHLVVSNYMLPVLNQNIHSNIFVCIAKLIIPFTLAYLLIFYLVFDIFCNAIAEITQFGDRQFYGDWWNSTSWYFLSLPSLPSFLLT